MSFPSAEEREQIRKELWTREQISHQRIEEATRRILEVSAELHLTVTEFETAVSRVKHRAVISIAD